MSLRPAEAITPLVLTSDEEENVGRTLESLPWARRVVVLDSGSTDRTEEIARGFANVSWQVRAFDNHRNQWEYGIRNTGIDSEYVLALDADMVVSPALVREIERRFLPGGFAGAYLPVRWCIEGHPLLGSFCPPQLRLFRRSEVRVEQRGHTQEFSVDGRTCRLRSPLLHDDRKPIERWVASQLSYSRLDAERLKGTRGLRLRDRLRKTGLMPAVGGLLAYFKAGGPFGGRLALRYAWERVVYECLLAIRLVSPADVERGLREEAQREGEE